MDCATTFRGVLEFTEDLTSRQYYTLVRIIGEDCRKYPEWEAPHLTHIDLKLKRHTYKAYRGLQWDDNRTKTSKLVKKVNLLMRLMQKEHPTFGLSGNLLAQGDTIDDVWVLQMRHNVAVKRQFIPIEDEPTDTQEIGGFIIC